MNKQVFILGSGFSKAINSLMPTMQELSTAVVADLESKRQPMPPGFGTPVQGDFERWLSFLVDTPPWLSAGQQQRNHASFSDIGGAVSDVLSAIQIQVASQAQPAWLQKLLHHWQHTDSTVITFNYDALVELAWLDQFGGPSTPWSDLYSVPLTPAAARSFAVIGGDRPHGGMRLLKLHGSLNWFYSGAGAPPGDAVFDVGIRGGWSTEGMTSRYNMYEVVDKEPLIVPPAAVKNPYYTNQTLRGQWRLAADAISEASEVVIMGFGLPATDLIVSSMLASLIRRNQIITPVSLDPTLAERLEQLLNPAAGILAAPSHIVKSFVGIDDPIAAWTRRLP